MKTDVTASSVSDHVARHLGDNLMEVGIGDSIPNSVRTVQSSSAASASAVLSAGSIPPAPESDRSWPLEI